MADRKTFHSGMIAGRRALTGIQAAILLLLLLIVGGCRSRNVIPPPGGSGAADSFDAVFNLPISIDRRHLIEISREWMGTPYEYAAAEKGKGTDCSGMVLQVYLEASGCKLPRNSAKQAEFCEEISRDDVVPGDLVFFATGKDPGQVSHVGIMLDNDSFIHASASKGVCVSKISTPYFLQRFMRFGRVPGMR